MENDWVAVEGNADARGSRYMSRKQLSELADCCRIVAETVVMPVFAMFWLVWMLLKTGLLGSMGLLPDEDDGSKDDAPQLVEKHLKRIDERLERLEAHLLLEKAHKKRE